MGVEPGIVEQVGRKRALPPIGPLVALVEMDAELLLQEIPQAVLAPPQRATGHACVEQVGELNPKVAFETDYVVFGAVQDLLNRRVGEDRFERREVAQRQGINQVVGTRRRELDEADALSVGIQAVGLGIDCKVRLSGENRRQAKEGFSFGDEDGRRQEAFAHGAIIPIRAPPGGIRREPELAGHRG